MSYLNQARCAKDHYILDRVAACAASAGIKNAPQWAAENIWLVSNQFVAAYEYAVDSGVENPGASPAAVTDEAIRAAVYQLIT